MFEFAKEPFDQIALPIDAPIDRSADQPLAGGGNVGFGPAGSDQIEQRIGVIASVGNDVAALESRKQKRRRTQIVVLSSRQHEPDRQTVLIDQSIDLGAQSSTRTTDGVILAPFFPPAACWWARMMELSMNAIECGDLAARASKICTQTPAFAHRLKRL